MTAKTTKAKKMTPEQQRRAFEAAARELGCDESPIAFEAAVKKVAQQKPERQITNPQSRSKHPNVTDDA